MMKIITISNDYVDSLKISGCVPEKLTIRGWIQSVSYEPSVGTSSRWPWEFPHSQVIHETYDLTVRTLGNLIFEWDALTINGGWKVERENPQSPILAEISDPLQFQKFRIVFDADSKDSEKWEILGPSVTRDFLWKVLELADRKAMKGVKSCSRNF